MGVVPEGSLGVLTRRGMTGCSPEPGTPAALRILRRGRRLPWVTSGMPPLRAPPAGCRGGPGPPHHALGSARYWTGRLCRFCFKRLRPRRSQTRPLRPLLAGGRAAGRPSLPLAGGSAACVGKGRPGCRARESLQQVPRAPGASSQRRPVSRGGTVRCSQGPVGRSEKQTAEKGPPPCSRFSCPSGCVMVGAVLGASHAARCPPPSPRAAQPARASDAAPPRGCAGGGRRGGPALGASRPH